MKLSLMVALCVALVACGSPPETTSKQEQAFTPPNTWFGTLYYNSSGRQAIPDSNGNTGDVFLPTSACWPTGHSSCAGAAPNDEWILDIEASDNEWYLWVDSDPSVTCTRTVQFACNYNSQGYTSGAAQGLAANPGTAQSVTVYNQGTCGIRGIKGITWNTSDISTVTPQSNGTWLVQTVASSANPAQRVTYYGCYGGPFAPGVGPYRVDGSTRFVNLQSQNPYGQTDMLCWPSRIQMGQGQGGGWGANTSWQLWNAGTSPFFPVTEMRCWTQSVE
jgi:hypothetical protein